MLDQNKKRIVNKPSISYLVSIRSLFTNFIKNVVDGYRAYISRKPGTVQIWLNNFIRTNIKKSEYLYQQKVDPAGFRGPKVLTVQVIHPTEDHLDCTDEICAFAVPHQPGRNL